MNVAPNTGSLKILVATVALACAEVAAFVAVRATVDLVGDTSLPPNTTTGAYVMPAAFVVITVLAAIHAIRVGRMVANGSVAPVKAMVAIAVAVALFAVLSPPIGSADNYTNTLMMRGWVHEGVSPYVATPNDFLDDPLHPRTAVVWRGLSVVYGPLWSIVSALPVIATDDLSAQLALMKGMNAVAYLAAGALLYARFRKKGLPGVAEASLAFWLFNPAALFEIANAGHNEGLLILPLAFVAIALVDEDAPRAIVGIVAAALLKWWPLVLVPALLGSRSGSRRWAWSAVVVAVLAMACTAPFHADGGIARMTATVFVQAAGDGVAADPFFYAPVRFAFYAVALFGGAEPVLAGTFARAAALIAFSSIVAFVCIARLRRTASSLDAATILVIALVGVAMAYVQPWYLLALAPFVFARNDGSSVPVMAWLAIAGFFCYLTGPGIVALGALLMMMPQLRTFMRSLRV